MPRYAALLRGVNVGQNVLKMERLRALCAEAGLKNVATYVQSGNVVFDGSGPSARWADAIEKKLAGQSRLPIAVMVRSAAEIGSILSGNPFLKKNGVEPDRLYVTFLGTSPGKSALAALDDVDRGSDAFHPAGREIYLHCPLGYGRTKLSNNLFEKALALKATTRNWKTVTALHAMLAS